MPKKNDSALRDRVVEYIKTKGMSVRAFEKALGFPNGSIAQYTDNTNRDTLNKIGSVFPDFDVDYIITGKRTAIDTSIYKEPVPYEFVQAMIEERKRHDDERKRHDEMNAELIRQNGELIEMLQERKKTDAHLEDDAICATAKESGLAG